jgi:hypothetical protein
MLLNHISIDFLKIFDDKFFVFKILENNTIKIISNNDIYFIKSVLMLDDEFDSDHSIYTYLIYKNDELIKKYDNRPHFVIKFLLNNFSVISSIEILEDI